MFAVSQSIAYFVVGFADEGVGNGKSRVQMGLGDSVKIKFLLPYCVVHEGGIRHCCLKS